VTASIASLASSGEITVTLSSVGSTMVDSGLSFFVAKKRLFVVVVVVVRGEQQLHSQQPQVLE
jgi:hypothetical protein